MAENSGWHSKDVLTWAILIWGFSRLIAKDEPLSGPGCQVNGMTQTGLTVPLWASQSGDTFTQESA